jgi:hypothetical protein
MVLTAEEKLGAALLLALILALCFGLYSIHLIDAGKAEEKAAVFKQQQKDEAAAQVITASWQARLTTAQSARQGEIDAANDAALKPFNISVQRYTLRSAVPASTPATGGGAAPAAGGVVCPGVLQESSEQLRADFAAAQRADKLTADYRDLYNSWPVGQTKK